MLFIFRECYLVCESVVYHYPKRGLTILVPFPSVKRSDN
jgi:hypothetical protein